MVNRAALTTGAKEKFLKSLATGASISMSARRAGVARQTYYDWRESDPQFVIDSDSAIESGTDVLEDSALKQAKEGSTALMVLLLKSRRPEKYKDRFENQHTGTNGDPLKIIIQRDGS